MIQDIQPALGGFAARVVAWQRQHGRHHLPWQGTRDPYRIWLSEIMLQQTQVGTVIGYYERFIERFPNIQTLGEASEEEVMPYWAGLGYYARARNLHRCARIIVADWNGHFPPTAEQIAALPGIGRSTAAAIAAFAYGERSPIMDGNVRRVFTRCFGISGVPSERHTEQRLWRTAEKALELGPPELDMTAYTQGLMDLGSQPCTRSRPNCSVCPLQHDCYARVNGLQHQLPTARKRKAVPQRETLVLVLEHQGRVLLEKRPSPGIWGGLWSFPEYTDLAALALSCQQIGVDPTLAQKMAGLDHVFTHFKLFIEPWYLVAGRGPQLPLPSSWTWMALHELGATALPTPIRKILQGLYGTLDNKVGETATSRQAQASIAFSARESIA